VSRVLGPGPRPSLDDRPTSPPRDYEYWRGFYSHSRRRRWGEIVDINLPRDKETGKTRGFGFVMFEDQRSTVLAVDNMNGASILGRIIRVSPRL
jgi:hypothetical protein